MAKKRILQVVQHLRPGGIETMALDLMERSSEDREVHILCLEGAREDTVASWSRLPAVATRLHFLEKRSGLDMPAVFRLTAMLEKLSIDVLHTHHIGPLIYGGIAARLAGGKRVVHTEHDAWHLMDARRNRVQTLINWIVNPVFVADAQLVAKAVKSAIPSIDPIIIHNGVDTERFMPGDKSAARRRFGLPLNVNLVGCAARLEAVKGHTDLIRALKLLPPNVHLALAGNGSLRGELQTLVNTYSLSDRVHFLGTVDDMATFHRAPDVFCMASEKEGLPLSPLEAQASGCPVVLTDVGGCREAICPDTGQLVAVGEPGMLANSLDQTLNAPTNISPRDFVCRNRNLIDTVSAYEALH